VPANLTPQYHGAEARYKEAKSVEEKTEALQEMLRVIPKHKGTEKLQADLKKRIAKLRGKAASRGAASRVGKRPFYYVDREGIGQLLVSGPPNSGKSSLIQLTTAAEPEIAEYPFVTRLPLSGMMSFEDVQIQLVDMPPLAEEVYEPWQSEMMGRADVVLFLFDITASDLLERTEFILDKVANLERVREKSPVFRFVANKSDLDIAGEYFEAWTDLFDGQFEAQPRSVLLAHDREELARDLFAALDVVRVYTKRPGHHRESNSAPFVLRRGQTVLDAAAAVHKDLHKNFQFARIWNPPVYNGQMVERTHEVEDGDLLEIHAHG
jgi:ribosome-interacting GTPase 1